MLIQLSKDMTNMKEKHAGLRKRDDDVQLNGVLPDINSVQSYVLFQNSVTDR